MSSVCNRTPLDIWIFDMPRRLMYRQNQYPTRHRRPPSTLFHLRRHPNRMRRQEQHQRNRNPPYAPPRLPHRPSARVLLAALAAHDRPIPEIPRRSCQVIPTLAAPQPRPPAKPRSIPEQPAQTDHDCQHQQHPIDKIPYHSPTIPDAASNGSANLSSPMPSSPSRRCFFVLLDILDHCRCR